MQSAHIILTTAILITLITSVFLIIWFRKTLLTGEQPSSLMAFIAILFTSGLDVGLILFPLTEFPVYETEAVYSFTNPLALEFGFWGFLVWGFYFLTTFYFCVVEPRLKLFEIGWVKVMNNLVIIATCAFTGFLFFSYLPDYITNIPEAARYALVAVVVLAAVISSTDIRLVIWLSMGSFVLFLALIAAILVHSDMGIDQFLQSGQYLGGYFGNLHRFVSPLTDYHAFYLFWWFAWSIMIGQFVARFVGGLRPWQLLAALLVLPSIPIALWFSILFYVHSQEISLTAPLQIAMIVVGIIFVVNSLDSLTRLYSENLNLTVERLGRWFYIAVHWGLLFGLILLYQFTPLKIEWIGMVVILLYACIYALIFQRRRQLAAASF
ncbi:BCCT family transporter [Parasphingorhabdus cellanae]|uniref:BCCT family transporter n=1 Tax=Parasphingorhabdus cellanae TaxID=2806553 RepID=A0ABX7T8K8_9SPHN|nr:BCCT family transporter [Parasphingorhabdus cellanae]QTD56774.1 BCCT family transporter [Parasphingorhabdus cellanae]